MAKKPGASGIILFAVVFGVAAALLLWKVEKDRAKEHKENWKTVFTARIDIPARAQITRDMIEATPVPDTLRVENAVTSPEQAVGRWTLRELKAKEQLRSTDAVAKEQLPTFSEQIASGKRLITIAAGELQAVGGVIRPGEQVDILATYFDVVKKREITQMILQNIKVFFVNGGDKDASTSLGAKSSLTLEVTPEVAELIAAAERKATLKLALRPKNDKSEIPRAVPDVTQIWALLETAQKIEVPGSTNAPVSYTPTKQGIKVFRGAGNESIATP